MPETFWTLLHNAAHWEFEIFLMLLFDGIIAGVCAPFVRKHWQHHVAHDQRDTAYSRSLKPDPADCPDCEKPKIGELYR